MTGRPADAPSRQLWRRVELIHAVTYFAETCLAANRELGCQGFWMGYFASRAAPMGPVPAAVVEATFFGFHPSRVRRAIPDAWDRTEPSALVTVRSAAAASALRSLCDGVDDVAVAATEPLQVVIDAADSGGRPFFAANREIRPADAVERLWQACTTLREHRGDGHVGALVAAGLDGCEANVLQTAVGTVPDEMLRQSRNWPVEEWDEARARLIERGLVDDGGSATVAGRELRAEIEDRTDVLAGKAVNVLDDDSFNALIGALDPVVRSVVASGAMPFPNPIGVPAPKP